MKTRFPHAVLLHGRAGIGKLAFAEGLAASLLCEAPQADGLACGQCLSCGWLVQGNHPDFRVITPGDKDDKNSKMEEGDEPPELASKAKKSHIVVDQIRALSELVGLSSHRQGSRIVLLHPAETLNLAAANALLKMLEEPPPDTIFILVSHQSQRLLPTIRSRCHKIAIPMPTIEQAANWLNTQGVKDATNCLAQAGGAPLLALEAYDAATEVDVETFARELIKADKADAFATSAHWGKAGLLTAVSLLQKWIYDVLSAKLYGAVRYYPKKIKSLQDISNKADMRCLLDFQRDLNQARGQTSHPLNAELQLEALMLKYTQLF
ncbi:MAG: DNA polymerase III subunit delta' [Methylophilaceae bacterium]